MERVLGSLMLPAKISLRLGKPLASKDQCQGHQGAIRTLLLGLAQVRIGIVLRGAFKIGIGQIVEGDDFLEVEQGALLLVEKPFQGRLVLEQLVGDAIQRLELHP